MTSTSKKSAKEALRKTLRKTLSSISQEALTSQSLTAQKTILSLPQFSSAQRVGIYLSMPKAEAQTDLLVTHALDSGKKGFVPYVYKGKERKVMDMLRLQAGEELGRDGWGIPTLEGNVGERENAMGGKGIEGGEEVEGLDVIVVPGMAFDDEGNRLGHGAGFYDAYLSRFCEGGKRRKPFLVGLCLAEQVLPPGKLVVDDWDWKVDAVAVGDGRLLVLEDTQ